MRKRGWVLVLALAMGACGSGGTGENVPLFLSSVREDRAFEDADDADLLRAGRAACAAMDGGATPEVIAAISSRIERGTLIAAAAVVALCPEHEDQFAEHLP